MASAQQSAGHAAFLWQDQPVCPSKRGRPADLFPGKGVCFRQNAV